MPAEPLKRPTLSTLANLWGQSIPAVSNDLARMGLTIQKDGVDGCTRAKIKLLRQSAMGRSTEEGVDLNDLKAEKIIAETELIRINIARESGTLVSIDDLEPLLANLAVSTRAELLSMANKVTDELELKYGIDIDRDIVQSKVEIALEHIARYPSVIFGSRDESLEFDETAAEDFDGEMVE